MIRFENVTKKYGSHVILDDIDLEVAPGEFVTITGNSGAGKTTLVHLLIGAETPTSGNIAAIDRDLRELDHENLQAYRREIGVVFQDYKLLPQKTVFENVAYALEVIGKKPYEIFERVPKLLKQIGLESHLDLYPHQLSGGEAQRTAFARALAHEPKLLILDEPTGNLDPENAKNIMDMLCELHRNGLTIFLVTHDPALLKRSPERIFEIRGGKIGNFGKAV